MQNFPKHIILSDRIYELTITKINGDRAFSRDLVDYGVTAENPLNKQDNWSTLLGASKELFEDYTSLRLQIPLEWLLIRFLSHYVRTNSVKLLSGQGVEVLNTMNYLDYLGREISDEDAEQILRIIFCSWIRVYPEENITLSDIYASTDISIHIIKRGINSLIFLNHVKEIAQEQYKVLPGIFDKIPLSRNLVSFDRKINRYYQEIMIEANEPFCFVIMPFKEEEFPQRIYTQVIKPLVENTFKISCSRVDEDFLPDNIDNKIYTYILRSAFIIAEVTSSNANVFYELGLAHMLEKDCIILTQKPVSEIPFDINKIRAKHYENDAELIEFLKKSISALAFKIR